MQTYIGAAFVVLAAVIMAGFKPRLDHLDGEARRAAIARDYRVRGSIVLGLTIIGLMIVLWPLPYRWLLSLF